MRFCWRILFLFLFLVLEISLFVFCLPSWLAPNLVLILIVCWSFLIESNQALIILAFLAGLFFDLFSNLPAATSALALMVISSFLLFLKRRFFVKMTFWHVAIFIFGASLMYYFLVWLEITLFHLINLSDLAFTINYLSLTKFSLQAMANMIFGSGIYFLLERLEHQKH